MKNRVYEIMTMSTYRQWFIRVWSESSTFVMGPDLRVLKVLDDLAIDPINYKPEEVVKRIEALGKIAAIEILDKKHHGALLYPDWS